MAEDLPRCFGLSHHILALTRTCSLVLKVLLKPCPLNADSGNKLQTLCHYAGRVLVVCTFEVFNLAVIEVPNSGGDFFD